MEPYQLDEIELKRLVHFIEILMTVDRRRRKSIQRLTCLLRKVMDRKLEAK